MATLIIKRGMVGLCVLFSLVGCRTSLPELRAKPPSRVGHVESNYLLLATCVTDALESSDGTNRLVYRLLDRTPGHSASLTGSVVGLILDPAPAVVLEITFTQETERIVRIETRNADGPGGLGRRGRWTGEQMWPLAERCAGKPIIMSGQTGWETGNGAWDPGRSVWGVWRSGTPYDPRRVGPEDTVFPGEQAARDHYVAALPGTAGGHWRAAPALVSPD